jgi:hypothetical protein
MIKDSLLLLVAASNGLLANAATRSKGARLIYPPSPNAEGTGGNNHTINYDSEDNAYYGSLFAGTPI